MLILYSTETAEVDICNRKIRDDSDLHINGITTNMKYEKKKPVKYYKKLVSILIIGLIRFARIVDR